MKQATNFTRSTLIVTAVTLSLLSVPLIAMQFSAEVNWSGRDFLVMGLLIFTTGLALSAILRHTQGFVQRLAVMTAVATTFLMIWANLAVGLIGEGGHWGNFLYALVPAVVITGTIVSRFSARGMERTMFASSITVSLIAVIALAAGMQNYAQSSINEIIAVNVFFAGLYAVAGLLFRFASSKQTPAAIR